MAAAQLPELRHQLRICLPDALHSPPVLVSNCDCHPRIQNGCGGGAVGGRGSGCYSLGSLKWRRLRQVSDTQLLGVLCARKGEEAGNI